MVSDRTLAQSGIQSVLHRTLPVLLSIWQRSTSYRPGAIIIAAVCLAVLGPHSPSLRAQTIDDGIMLAGKSLCAGALYSQDTWDQYWEGTLERVNGNIGTIKTQGLTMAANYGITGRINVIANVPYIWTNASQGVLHGQAGFQDFTLAAKVRALSIPVKQFGAVRAIAVVYGSVPMTNYTPDLQPLSIGTHSKTISGRATLNYLGKRGMYLNGTAAYTFRGNVTLDRSSYYTNGQLYLSNQVAMPNLFNYGVSVGYRKNNTSIFGDFAVQQARGGGDIRPQDMPFVSNRTNFSKAGLTLKFPIPVQKLKDLQYWLLYSNTFQGRNVGQSSTITTGFMYTFNFEKRATP